MNTVVESRIGYENVTEESGDDCKGCDQIVESHSTNRSKIFSTIHSPIVRLKSQANVFVSDVFRRSQTADSDNAAWLEKVRNDVRERLKREIEKMDMESSPHGDSGFSV